MVLYIGYDNIALFVRRVMHILHLSGLFAGVRSTRKQTINLVCGGNILRGSCGSSQHNHVCVVAGRISNVSNLANEGYTLHATCPAKWVTGRTTVWPKDSTETL